MKGDLFHSLLWMLVTIYREILTPVLFSPPLPSLSAGEFKTERIPTSQTVSLKTQLFLGEFKTGRNFCRCKRAKITLCETNPVYSNLLVKGITKEKKNMKIEP